ncbi:hypothetical protein CDL12_05761 [Handroanthus impetiginosus]|uniref:Uncharacterized protein n=1 Tax=Handroanthus impetiginosus TaxID=429701 RepID=A0A2G9G9W8_9LAMI|nr:hypothetical protein CDL12_25400 [Handroanthus impetiginosus]PIN21551.1 hypothetical protein CDL12_05761 [Handroanthus impetiginosus]
MKSSRILAFMTTKSWTFLLLILLSTSKSVAQKGMLCVSDCETCPVICSPPPSTTPKPPREPPKSHHSPPQLPAHPAPPPPSRAEGIPPPPELYVYNPGTMQQNFSYPYYYFYSSKATCSVPLDGFINLFGVFMLFQVMYAFR